VLDRGRELKKMKKMCWMSFLFLSAIIFLLFLMDQATICYNAVRATLSINFLEGLIREIIDTYSIESISLFVTIELQLKSASKKKSIEERN
jgi:hypothetical protein